jgi:hypothetical protein
VFAVLLQRLDLGVPAVLVRDTPVERLPLEHAGFDLGHVQPTLACGHVMEREPLGEVPLCVLGLDGLVEDAVGWAFRVSSTRCTLMA